jgi:hypothetical protein
MVAAIVPKRTGHRARGPRAIRTPADTPAAGPENGNTFRFGQESKAKPCSQEIYETDRDSEPDRPNPLRQVDAVGQLMLNLFRGILAQSVLDPRIVLLVAQDLRDCRSDAAGHSLSKRGRHTGFWHIFCKSRKSNNPKISRKLIFGLLCCCVAFSATPEVRDQF